MSEQQKRRELLVGDGEQANYPALMLFLAGAVLGMYAVFVAVNHGNFVPPLAAGLLCSLAAIFVFAAKKGKPEKRH